MASTVTWIGKGLPTVVLTPEVKRDMEIICKNAGTDEIGWLGLVKRDMEENEFKVYRILPIPKQEVHATTTEITPEGQAELLMNLLEKNEITMEETNDIRFWGHSHVNMTTSPSGQDNSQMDTLTENLKSDENAQNRYFVRCITNKKGEYNFAIYQYDVGIALTEAPWHLEMTDDADRTAYWKAQIEENVSELRTRTYNYGKKGKVGYPQGNQFGGHYPPYSGAYDDYDPYFGYGYDGYADKYKKNTKGKKQSFQKAGKK